jgi:plasmid maintenance system antidote protein VapI
MYPNLRAEMARHGVKTKDLAAALGVCQKSINDKMTCRTKNGFSLDQAVKIRDAFFPGIRLDDLFENKSPRSLPLAKRI